jgi:predicted RNase H-like HicB family nuclease
MITDYGSMEIQFTTQVFKEGRTYIAHAPELDVSSCGGTKDRALKNLTEAVRLFLEEAGKMGTLDQILEEAGFTERRSKLEGPRLISTQRITLPLHPVHAKT